MPTRKKILVAMSGGVDSSTVAAILRRDGHEVLGVGLRLPLVGLTCQPERSCCGVQGMDDARRVAGIIDIPFYVLDYQDFFERSVIEYFCRSYLSGETPNPCVECNRVVKFGRLLELAGTLGADYVATGHYAQIGPDSRTGRHLLKRGADAEKDQSYFLYPLSQRQLSQALFPLGAMTKEETREAAAELGLHVSRKPASQDICFLGDTDYRHFLAERFPEALRPGPIVDREGRVLGEHRGTAFYTIGQRSGLGVAAGHPLYVLATDPASGRVVVGRKEELQTREIAVGRLNWIAFEAPPGPLELEVKVRYRQEGQPATVSPVSGGRVIVSFAAPQARPAPGQSAVFYDGDLIVGGGIVESP